MKATELRIGNYVWENYSGEMIIRSIIYNSPVTTHPKDNGSHTIHLSKTLKLPICGYDISAIKPIPITEEWLLKFGFEKLANDGRYGYRYYIAIADYWYVIERDWRKEQSHFFGIEYTDCPNPKDDHIYHSFTFKIKHIHQLQNLYFALTNKELLCNG